MPFRRLPAAVPGSAARTPDARFPSDPGAGGLRLRLRRFLVRRRRLLAALACCAAAGAAVSGLAPPDAERSTVVLAARDLAAGSVLGPGSLKSASIPSEAVVPGSYSGPGPVVGRRLATPLLQGSPVTEVSLAGSGLLAGTAPGTVAVPLRPADPSVLALLDPGQLVTVVSAAEGTGWSASAETDAGPDGKTEVLATSVPVLWVSGAAAGGSLGPDRGGGEGLVVVAADRNQASRLAAASGTGSLYLVLTGR